VAALGHKDVRRLDVPVNDSLVVGSTECVCHLNPPFKHLLKRQRLAGNAMLQRGTFHEFHGNKRLAVLLVNFVDRANVGMIQRGRRARLSTKTFQSLWNLGQVVRKKFKSDKPAEGGILGLVDNTHTTAAQLFDDSVVRDSLADHWVDDGEAAKYKLAWLKASALVIQEIIEVGESNVERAGVLLFGIEKLFEVHL
jgi:hypothetical protein